MTGMADSARRLQRVERLADLLDTRFRIPGTRIPIGADGILSIVPVVGDTVAGAMSAWLIWEAHRMGARKRTLGRMVANAGLDYVVGSIPVVGTIFDIAFKANSRNLKLLKRELAQMEPEGARRI